MSSREEKVERLMEEGFRLLEESDLPGAIEIGNELKKLRHSSAFEILALAYDKKGEKGKAIAILEEGTGKAPDVWRLWQLLGNCYSDDGRFPDCHDAYRRALECPQVNAGSVLLNVAIALGREDRLAEALETLDRLTSEDDGITLRSRTCRIDILNRLERYEEAIRLAEKIEAELPEGASDEETAALHSQHGVALWKDRRTRERALEYAWKAIGLRNNDPEALWLIREIEGEISKSARYFRILVEGRWVWEAEDEPGPLGFFKTYDVVAENPDEALELLQRFEPPEVRNSLRIESSEEIEFRPGDPKGVYWVTGYHIFPLDDGDREPAGRTRREFPDD